jgi:hypothetical protein
MITIIPLTVWVFLAFLILLYCTFGVGGVVIGAVLMGLVVAR